MINKYISPDMIDRNYLTANVLFYLSVYILNIHKMIIISIPLKRKLDFTATATFRRNEVRCTKNTCHFYEVSKKAFIFQLIDTIRKEPCYHAWHMKCILGCTDMYKHREGRVSVISFVTSWVNHTWDSIHFPRAKYNANKSLPSDKLFAKTTLHLSRA